MITLFVHVNVFAPNALSEVVNPKQIDEFDELAVTVGEFNGVTIICAVFEQEPLVAVTVYAVVTEGLAITFGPKVVFRPKPSDQL